jgi:hypothetical protein
MNTDQLVERVLSSVAFILDKVQHVLHGLLCECVHGSVLAALRPIFVLCAGVVETHPNTRTCITGAGGHV